MKKGMRNVLIGSGIAAAGLTAAGTASYTVTRKLIQVALDREEPGILQRGREKLTGSVGYEGFYSAVDQAAQRLEAASFEEVQITSHDGLRLVGHWHRCPDAKRVVVAMHGWRSSWSYDFGLIAGFLHDRGCSVLYAEQRGQNSSEGEYMTFGMLERFDCLEWIRWVDARSGGTLPVYLAGVSMGASTVLMTAGLQLPESVRGIVADCGFTSPDAIWKHVAERNLHFKYGLHGTMIEKLCQKRIQLSAKGYSTTEAMGKCGVPVLFIHGTEDALVPVTMSYENYRACAGEKRLFVVPGAGHGQSYYVDPAGYEREVEAFWARYDGGGKISEDTRGEERW